MSTKRFEICGMALMKAITILKRPGHALSRRSRRSRRSIRKKEMLTPVSARRMVMSISPIERETMTPSSVFQPSLQ